MPEMVADALPLREMLGHNENTDQTGVVQPAPNEPLGGYVHMM